MGVRDQPGPDWVLCRIGRAIGYILESVSKVIEGSRHQPRGYIRNPSSFRLVITNTIDHGGPPRHKPAELLSQDHSSQETVAFLDPAACGSQDQPHDYSGP